MMTPFRPRRRCRCAAKPNSAASHSPNRSRWSSSIPPSAPRLHRRTAARRTRRPTGWRISPPAESRSVSRANPTKWTKWKTPRFDPVALRQRRAPARVSANIGNIRACAPDKKMGPAHIRAPGPPRYATRGIAAGAKRAARRHGGKKGETRRVIRFLNESRPTIAEHGVQPQFRKNLALSSS